ncbi:MAG: hypothetical protein FD130_2347, partial [Halothiobacillaceae bacterium]
MTTLKKKSHISTCITALTLLAALPTVHAAAPDATYNKTETSFVSPDAQDFITYQGLAQDSYGNVLLLGTARGYGIDFDPGHGVDTKGWLRSSTLFITKQNANGSYGGTLLIG